MLDDVQNNGAEMRERLAKRGRKIAMLVQSSRNPEKSQGIRTQFKRREKLTEMKKSLQRKRSRG